jgi:hypothetical protein
MFRTHNSPVTYRGQTGRNFRSNDETLERHTVNVRLCELEPSRWKRKIRRKREKHGEYDDEGYAVDKNSLKRRRGNRCGKDTEGIRGGGVGKSLAL